MDQQAVIKALPGIVKICGKLADDFCLTGIAYDSRKVEPGFAFVAIRGEQADGHDFIAQAVDKGAVLIIAEREATLPVTAPLILVTDSRRALAALSAAYYGHPDRRMRVIGVTGTNGKTTTTNLIKYLLEQSGHKSGVIGTVSCLAGEEPLPELLSASTTPESLELFSLFSLMEQAGCAYAVIEASSHALAQGRVSATEFAGAVFTNLTQDHLDYHCTMEAYGRSKATLFALLDEKADNRYGVVNLDDAYAARVISACRAPVWTYGVNEGAKLRLLHFGSSMRGMNFSVSYQGRTYWVEIPLIGKFNIYNALAAMCVALAEGLGMERIVSWMKTAPQVAGRFELVDAGQDFAVVVDYAHTPDGLENLLSAARALKPRRLISVFGCGGNRDNTKRPIMGRIAGAYSNVVIITSDNPRFENPHDIIDMVESGIRDVGNNYLIEEDRAKAIRLAVNMAEAGDMVVIAGKGHEDYQIVQGVKHHFNDREVALDILRGRLGK